MNVPSLYMPSSKVRFSEEDYEFIDQYREATGVSLQRFVTLSIKDMIERLKVDQQLKDLPHIKET